jgi:hypothetical protein
MINFMKSGIGIPPTKFDQVLSNLHKLEKIVYAGGQTGHLADKLIYHCPHLQSIDMTKYVCYGVLFTSY